MTEQSYIWDANCLIESAGKWYPFDVVPGFWDAVVSNNKKRRVFTIDKIAAEIKEGKINDWLKSVPNFILPTDTPTLQEYAKIIEYVQSNSRYAEPHRQHFASGADGYLVAYAKSHNMTVVTQETRVPENSPKIKIPNLCEHFNVRYIALPEMIKMLDMQLILNRIK
jgi:hypothetical protein